MKHECYETINNKAYFYDTAFNVAVILEQLLDYNSMSKEKEDTRKDKEHVIKPKLRAKASDHVPNEDDNNKLIKEKKENNWIMLQHVPIDYFCKKNTTTQSKRKRAEIATDMKC